MKDFIQIILYYLVLCLAGYMVRSAVKCSSKNIYMEFAYSYVFGVWVCYGVQLWLCLCGMHIDYDMMVYTVFIGLGAMLALNRSKLAVEGKADECVSFIRQNRYIFGFLLMEVMIIMLTIYLRPVSLNDDFANFSGNSKRLFFNPFLDKSYFSLANHSDYPLWIMIQQVYLSQSLGRFDDFICKMPNFIFMIHVFLIAIRFACTHTTAKWCSVWLMILISMPFYMRVAFDSTGEIVMSLACGIWIMTVFMESNKFQWSKNRKNIFILSTIPSLIKTEGVYISLLMILLLCYYEACSWKHKIFWGIRYLVVFAWVNVPFIMLKLKFTPREARFSDFDLANFSEISSLLYKLSMEVKRFLIPNTMYLILPLLALSLWLHNVFLKKGSHAETYNAHRFISIFCAGVLLIYGMGCASVGWVSELGRLMTHLIMVLWVYLVMYSRNLDNDVVDTSKKNIMV